MGYLYINQPTHLIGTNVYKVGRTFDIMKRQSQYTRGTVLYLSYKFVQGDIIELERLLLQWLRCKFQSRTDEGREYFEAPIRALMREFNEFVREYDCNDEADDVDSDTQANETVHIKRNQSVDPVYAILLFVKETRSSWPEFPIIALELFTRLLEWLQVKNITSNVRFCQFETVLHKHYDISSKSHRFSDGTTSLVLTDDHKESLEEENFIKTFIKKNIIQTGVRKDLISLSDMLARFYKYCKVNDTTIMKKDVVTNKIEKEIGTLIPKSGSQRNFWRGITWVIDN